MGRKFYVITTLFLFVILPIGKCKPKTVRLIVPHKIKYIHHTHVLLVRPRKKPANIRDDVDDETNFVEHVYRRDMPRTKEKVKYIIPYVAASKNSVMYHDSEDRDTHRSKTKERQMLPFKTRKSKTSSKKVRDRNQFHPTHIPRASEESILAAARLNPDDYEAKYIGYNTYSDDEAESQTHTWTSAQKPLMNDFSDNEFNSHEWRTPSFSDRSPSPTENHVSWHSDSYSLPGREDSPGNDYYDSYNLAHTSVKKQVSHGDGWNLEQNSSPEGYSTLEHSEGRQPRYYDNTYY